MRTRTKGIKDLLQAILKAQKSREFSKNGFTLVEAIVVVVVIGILSSIAMPNFIAARDKASAGAVIGTMASFSKACGSNMASEESTALGVPSSIKQTNTCDGQKDVTFENENEFNSPGNLNGMRCGADLHADTEAICKLTVDKITGTVSGEWS